MHTKRLWRSIVSYSTFAALLFQVLGVVNPATARAATPQLRITEIHWAGSTGNVNDEWVEIKNVSGAIIDFTVTPYDFQSFDGTTINTIASLGATDGVLAIDQNIVLHKETAPSGMSTLLAVDDLDAVYKYKPTLDLPNVATAYRLMDVTAVVVEDLIDDSDGAGPLGIPFAGSLMNGTASMSRTAPLDDGTLQTSWYTAMTMGVNFVPGTMQWGTPGENNVEVMVPSAFNVQPSYTSVHGTTVTVAGTATTGDTVTTTFLRDSYGPTMLEYAFSDIAAAGTFTTSAIGLDVGRYTISAVAYNANGDKSMSVNVPVMVATTDYDYVVTPLTSTVPTPTLDAYPAVTAAAMHTFNGTLDTTAHTYNSVEIMKNGKYYSTVPAVGGTYTASVAFTPNMVNTIQFFAVDSTGLWSMPVVATVTHDNSAPLAVDVTKVQLVGNVPGQNDTIRGLAGAAEANTTLSIYGDAAQTQLIATLIVAADGSFPITDIGDNKYASVWLVLKDAAGNMSVAAKVDNQIAFKDSAVNLRPFVTEIGETSVKVNWHAITGATSYRLKYKGVGGSYSAPINLCTSGVCGFSTTIINLSADTDYVFAIAAVDQYGNESAYADTNTRTLVPAPVMTPAPEIPAPVVTQTVRRTDVVTRTSPTPTPTPEPTATPEETGDVQSAATDTARNWTPWIILGVLVGIAVLATAGYFYWFGGEAGEMAMTGMGANEAKEEAAASSTKKGASSGSSPPEKPTNKDKRW